MAWTKHPRHRNSFDETEATAKTSSSAATEASGTTALESPTAADDANILPFLEAPGDKEKRLYYSHFPSHPHLLGRTSSGVKPWFFFVNPPGPNVYYPFGREALLKSAVSIGPVGRHPLHEKWTASTLNSVKRALAPLDWTSIDVLRMGETRLPENERTVVVWVGVDPRIVPTTPWAVYAHVLRSVRKALDADGLEDVECELRSSRVSLATGPRLLPPARIEDGSLLGDEELIATLAVTTTIGQPISPRDNPWSEGTLGMYLEPAEVSGEGGHRPNGMVWGLTCRHVVFPPTAMEVPGDVSSQEDNARFFEVLLPSQKQLKKAMALTNLLIRRAEILPSPNDILSRAMALSSHLETLAASTEARLVGHVYRSPPMAVNKEPKFTRDWALIALDRDRFPSGFQFDNIVDLYTDSTSGIQTQKMVNKTLNNVHFKFPLDGQMRLKGTIPLREILRGRLSHPFVNFRQDDVRLIVLKRGRTSGLTTGVALDVESVVRTCFGAEAVESSKWTIIDIRQTDARCEDALAQPRFSEGGDSGAIIFDLSGRVGGMLTGGTRDEDRLVKGYDLTYAIPFERLLMDITQHLGHPLRVV